MFRSVGVGRVAFGAMADQMTDHADTESPRQVGLRVYLVLVGLAIAVSAWLVVAYWFDGDELGVPTVEPPEKTGLISE